MSGSKGPARISVYFWRAIALAAIGGVLAGCGATVADKANESCASHHGVRNLAPMTYGNNDNYAVCRDGTAVNLH